MEGVYKRRYTLPFITKSLSFEDEEMELRKNFPYRHKVYDYTIPPQDLKNERPFFTGRKPVPESEKPKNLPLPTPIHVREILSDEELENESPFMRGRVKVPKEIMKARRDAQWRMFKVLDKRERSNERPFMHGRLEVSENPKQLFVQMAPVPTTPELENERPFMHGRNGLKKEIVERRQRRRLVQLVRDVNASSPPKIGLDKLVDQKSKLPTQKHTRRMCPPCEALNKFRKTKIVPAVKSVHGFLRGRTDDYSTEKLIKIQPSDIKKNQLFFSFRDDRN